jgi:hypothetical protein
MSIASKMAKSASNAALNVGTGVTSVVGTAGVAAQNASKATNDLTGAVANLTGIGEGVTSALDSRVGRYAANAKTKFDAAQKSSNGVSSARAEQFEARAQVDANKARLDNFKSQKRLGAAETELNKTKLKNSEKLKRMNQDMELKSTMRAQNMKASANMISKCRDIGFVRNSLIRVVLKNNNFANNIVASNGCRIASELKSKDTKDYIHVLTKKRDDGSWTYVDGSGNEITDLDNYTIVNGTNVSVKPPKGGRGTKKRRGHRTKRRGHRTKRRKHWRIRRF